MSDGGSKANTQRGALVGTEVSSYRIVELLGAGGMGEVYRAEHGILGVARAIKVIHDDASEDRNAAARFEREAVILARLQHPNVVQVVDFGHLPNGWPFLCMEYIEGCNLEDEVEQNGPLSYLDALDVLLQLARVLEYTHGQGVVHRDLKPGNVLLREGDPSRVAVIDFGLVRLMSTEALTKLTAEREVVGSPLYMAPEQADGSPVITGAADVYALGGIAYWLLGGQPVFNHFQILELIYAHAEEPPQRLSTRCPYLRIPTLLDDLLLACLAKSPEARPGTEELIAHLVNLARDARADPSASARIALDRTMAPAPGADPIEPGSPAASPVAAREAPEVAPTSPATGGAAQQVARGSLVAPPLPGRSEPVTAGGEVVISDSLASEIEGGGAWGILFSRQKLADPEGVRDALATQILAVITEIGGALAPGDPRLRAQIAEVERLEGELGEIEIEIALADSETADGSVADRESIAARRTESEARAAATRDRLDAARRQLVRLVEGSRAAAGEAQPLFAELDDLVARAEPIPRGPERDR